MKHNFAERNKERLLSRKDYLELGFGRSKDCSDVRSFHHTFPARRSEIGDKYGHSGGGGGNGNDLENHDCYLEREHFRERK
ncbi:unnamed protein product [Camellia sinensis]